MPHADPAWINDALNGIAVLVGSSPLLFVVAVAAILGVRKFILR